MATLANKRVRKKKGSSSSSSWSDLPKELLESIKKRLFYIDQLNFRTVCKSWRCIGEEEEGVRNNIPPIPQMPWLLVYSFDRYEPYQSSWLLIDPMYKREYRVNTKSIKKKMNIRSNSNTFHCHESKNGWLLISSVENQKRNTTALFLYSPFLDENNNCIELPILSFDTCMATFTSNPLDDDCTVVTLNTSFQEDAIIIHTYGRGHSSWNSLVFKCVQFSPRHVYSWLYTDEGLFYYVISDGRVGTFDMAREEWNVFPPLPTTMVETLQLLWDDWIPLYMMKSSQGELFLISECNFIHQQTSPWYYDCQYIYRLDLSSMTWKDLRSIGERVLFIGNGYKAVLNSSVLKTKQERKGISNVVYCCSAWLLKYCTVHDYTLRDDDNGYPRKQRCSKHYGHSSFLSSFNCKLFIDPPLPQRPR